MIARVALPCIHALFALAAYIIYRCVHLTFPQHKILTQRWGQRQQWDSGAVVLRRFLLACQTGNFLWMSPLMVFITGAIMAYIIGSWGES